ncbi:MAG: hypothetical protein GXO07_03160 [Crenarchaeota archaeon]|nr:hypothetical protein [Thermoproteota archaeon]
MLLVYVLSSIAPLIALALRRLAGRGKYLALLVLAPFALTLYDFSTCSITTLQEWYWLNCGLPLPERLFTAITMPTFLFPLMAGILVAIALRENKDSLYVLATLLSASVLFYWSIYLELNYPMISPPVNLPPLGYSVVRSQWFMIYLPLLMASAALFVGYAVAGRRAYLYGASLLAFLSAPASASWALWAYGLPLPPTAYSTALYLYPLTLVSLIHAESKLGLIAALSALALASAVPRLLPLGFGGMPSPFFSLQTSMALALLITYVYSASSALRRAGALYDGRFLGVHAASLMLFAASLTDFALSAGGSFFGPAILPFLAASLIITSANLLLVLFLKERSKIGLLSLPSALTPWTSVIAAVGLSVYELFKGRKAFDALMVLASLVLGFALIYGSWLSSYHPLTPSGKVLGVSKVEAESRYYQGNLTAVKRVGLYNVTISGSNTTLLRSYHYVNIFMGKYLPPNNPSYFAWSEPAWTGLGTCALGLRPLLVQREVWCTPLGAFTFLGPLLGAAVVAIAYFRRR